jgi:Ni/Co efflux regulator RcnB
MEYSMNRKAVVSAVMAMCLATSGLSFAQGHGGGRNDQGRDDQGRNAQGQRNGPPGHRAMPVRQPDYRGDRGDRGRHLGQYGNPGQMQRNERGAGPDHQFYRGGRLPVQYRTQQYVVNDWRGHHLSAPPRGYHWVQTGGDYVLVAIATGIILQLLLSN